MEWILLILWLSIINGALGGQYVLNWMGNQQRFVGNQPVGVSPGVMTWWRELSKLAWAVIAVIIEVIRGKKIKYFWPGIISMATIMVCGFTGVIENIGFFYLPRYYSPHLFAPYVNIYLALLPFFGKFLFNAPIRKAHWIGILLVITGLTIPYLPRILGAINFFIIFICGDFKVITGFSSLFGGVVDPKSVLDGSAIIWIIIINCCLFSQQILNNKTVQTAFKGVGPNALVVWREIWKMVFITSALLIIPFIGDLMNVNIPNQIKSDVLAERVLPKLDANQKKYLLNCYTAKDDSYIKKENLDQVTKENVKKIFASTEYHRFFSLFQGNIIPKNWWPILFVVLAGFTGYIYSFGFFKLARFSAHFWVPYTNVYLAIIPFVMFLFGQNVTTYQIVGAVITTAGLMVGVSDYKKNKIEEIEKKYK